MGLDTVEFVLALEEKFSIDISDGDAAELGIVGDIARYVVLQSASQNHTMVEFETVLREVIDLLVDTHGISRQRISSASDVVTDLGLD